MEELFLSCQEGDVDWLELSLIENNQLKIAKGTIEITYGYVNFNSEGNVDDSCDESIDYYTSDIEKELLRIVDEFETWVFKEKEFVEVIRNKLDINF